MDKNIGIPCYNPMHLWESWEIERDIIVAALMRERDMEVARLKHEIADLKARLGAQEKPIIPTPPSHLASHLTNDARLWGGDTEDLRALAVGLVTS